MQQIKIITQPEKEDTAGSVSAFTSDSVCGLDQQRQNTHK